MPPPGLATTLAGGCLVAAFSAAAAAAASAGKLAGSYASLEWMDVRRVLMRVAPGEDLPPAEEEVVLDELEHWKWRVEMAAAGGAVLVTFSQCPHGLGLLPVALEWRGGGRWRTWSGTFQYARGLFSSFAGGGGIPAARWDVISDSAACEGSPGLKAVGKELVGVDIEACRRECERRPGCKAVDFYRRTRWCLFWDQACTEPGSAHDGASSHRVAGVRDDKRDNALHAASMSFLAAKQWCQDTPDCRGFSHEGVWPDQEREGGVPREVLFAAASDVVQRSRAEGKWHSYVRRDNPRANCNPEGEQFECPNNPYACLGLSMDADEAAVKQAYRALSKQMHPDKIKASARTKETVKQAEAAFRDISESHEALRDPQRRREADIRLQRERQQWQESRESVQDLYIKEPQISSLEPESYPVLVPKGQEWLVHFFLPANGECKQMKVAMGRVVKELGTGEEERYHAARPRPNFRARFEPGDVFRGRLRKKSLALKSEGAGAQEGDAHIALVVGKDGSGRLHIEGEEVEVTVQVSPPEEEGGRVQAVVRGEGRLLRGGFDRSREWFRGAVLANAREVASFVLQLDAWAPRAAPEGTGRRLPRLFGAVNCGRFADFCKRKGADPAKTKDFPQVRVLFPGETRFEVYTGRPLGKDLAAFAREATRPTGTVTQLDLDLVAAMQAGAAANPWLLLLRRTPPGTGSDCPLGRSALPMLRRTAPRLAGSRLRAGWVDCAAHGALCGALGAGGTAGGGSCWGSFVLARLGGAGPGAREESCGGCSGCRLDDPSGLIVCSECSFSQAGSAGKERREAPAHLPALTAGSALWDAQALPGGEAGPQGLLAALEAAARTAELLDGTPGTASQAVEDLTTLVLEATASGTPPPTPPPPPALPVRSPGVDRAEL